MHGLLASCSALHFETWQPRSQMFKGRQKILHGPDTVRIILYIYMDQQGRQPPSHTTPSSHSGITHAPPQLATPPTKGAQGAPSPPKDIKINQGIEKIHNRTTAQGCTSGWASHSHYQPTAGAALYCLILPRPALYRLVLPAEDHPAPRSAAPRPCVRTRR